MKIKLIKNLYNYKRYKFITFTEKISSCKNFPEIQENIQTSLNVANEYKYNKPF